MKKRNHTKPSKVITIRLQYHSQEEVDLIKQAADCRGIGFGLFQRTVCLNAAKLILATPPDPIIGFSNSAAAELQAQL
jgi:hypothetical protein